MNDWHFYEPRAGHGLPRDPLRAILGPRPIGWISTRSAAGVANLAPYSFFSMLCDRPAIVGFSSIGAKDSLENIRETEVFACNLVTRRHAEAMNETAQSAAPSADEFKGAGLEAASCKVIECPPRSGSAGGSGVSPDRRAPAHGLDGSVRGRLADDR